MGREKALLPWGDGDLLGHTLARLAAVASEVRILSGPTPRFLERGFPVDTDTPDVPPFAAGPLAGLLAALTAAAARAALVLAVDLPLVPAELLWRLVERLPGLDAVVPSSPRGPEPLCAVYGPGCLEPIRRRMGAGERKATVFWPEVRVLQITPDELADLGDPEGLFLNVNAPADYERARERGAGRARLAPGGCRRRR